MSSMSPHWQVAASATHICTGIVTMTTIAVSLVILHKLWKTQNKSRDKDILILTQASTRPISELVLLQTPPTTATKLQSIHQDARDELNPDISVPVQASTAALPAPVDHSPVAKDQLGTNVPSHAPEPQFFDQNTRDKAISILAQKSITSRPNGDVGSEGVPLITLPQASSNFEISKTNTTIIRNGDGQFTKIQRNLAYHHIMGLVTLPNINYHMKKHDIPLHQCDKAMFNNYQNRKKGPCFTKGTTAALLRGMADCITGSYKSRMYILSGLASIEISTIAYTVASRAADLNLLGASFCFSRDEADRNNAKKFFTTIAYQLCVYDETFAKAIGDVVKTEGGSAATTKDPQVQLKTLILDPLRSIVQSRSRPIVIVVDALDECDEEDAFSVFTGLSQLVCDLPSFKVILTTRPQPFLDASLSRQNGHNIFHLQDIEDMVVDGDIQLYLKHYLSLEQVQKHYPMWQWCASDEEIDFLVRAVDRFFIIASTAVRYIFDKTASNPSAQMQKLLRASAYGRAPFNLDYFYTIILRNIAPVNGDDDDMFSHYRTVVGAIISIQRPLPASTLSHLIDINVEEIHAVLNKLQSVILLGGDDIPRVYHKSFPEYLTDQARCKDPYFQIDPRICHTQIVTRCFEIMDNYLKYNILGLGDPARFMTNEDGLKEDGITSEQLEEKIPQQLRYACVYWVKHVKTANTEDADLANGLEKFLAKHMLHWFEVLSLVGKLDSAHVAIAVVLKLLKLSPDLHQLLSDVIRFIAKFYEVIKRSALHTYYSALSFTPTDSLLYRRYNKEAIHSICVIKDGPERWDPIVADLRHGEAVDVIKFSLDSARFVSCSEENIGDGIHKQGWLQIWDAATGTPISTISGDKFAVTNDFSTIASSRDNIITLYNMNGGPSGTILTTSSKVQKLALSSESSRVAAASSDETVWLWERSNAKLIDRFDGFGGSSQLEFSSSGTKLAYSSANGIKLREGISGRFIADLRCQSSHKFEFSGDGSRIACVSHASGLTLWNSESGGLICAVRDLGDIADTLLFGCPLAISTNGSLLATADRDQVILWRENNDSLAQIKVLELKRPQSMAFLLDNILAIISFHVQLYNVKTHSFIHTFDFLLDGYLTASAFSPDFTHLAIGDHKGNVNLCDIQGIDTSGSPPKGNATVVSALALSHDCSRLACGFVDGTVELWDTSPTKRRIVSHQAHKRMVQAVVFSPDGSLFASGSSFPETQIKLWTGKDGVLCGTLEVPSTGFVIEGAVALSNSILVAAEFGGVTLWSLNTLTPTHTFTHIYETSRLSIAENNALVAVAHSDNVSLLDAVNYTIITTFRVLDKIHTMTFLPDNSQLVVQSKVGVLLSFNLINKCITKGAIFEHIIQLPDVSLWHGVPIWHCLDKEQHYFAALFSQHKSIVPVLWIPRYIGVRVWTQGSSMIALGCCYGRVVLLRLPVMSADRPYASIC